MWKHEKSMKNHLKTSSELSSTAVVLSRLSGSFKHTLNINKQTLHHEIPSYITMFTRKPGWNHVKIACFHLFSPRTPCSHGSKSSKLDEYPFRHLRKRSPSLLLAPVVFIYTNQKSRITRRYKIFHKHPNNFPRSCPIHMGIVSHEFLQFGRGLVKLPSPSFHIWKSVEMAWKLFVSACKWYTRPNGEGIRH